MSGYRARVWLPLGDRKYRIVDYKCSGCGKNQGVRIVDGKPAKEVLTCRKCGKPLMPFKGKASITNGRHTAAAVST